MITRNPSTRRFGSNAHVQLGARLALDVSLHPGDRHRHGAALLAALVTTSVFAFVGCGQDDEPSVESNSLTPRRSPSPPNPQAGDDNDPPPVTGDDDDDDDDDPAPEFNGGPLPNGLELPANYSNWAVIGVVDAADDSIRVIVGNPTAVAAARARTFNPWPDGSMLMHYVWIESDNAFIEGAKSPGDFRQLTLMVKDDQEYAADGGWAYGLWRGSNLVPADAGFDRPCVECHTREVPDQDYVFTRPGALPSLTAVGAAGLSPSGLAVPSDILDWAVIGVVNRSLPAGQTPASPLIDQSIRVIVGNDLAVGAAREGLDGEWPEGAQLAHFAWAADDNPDAPDAVAPGEFQAITLMEKQGDDFTIDGGWKYGVWTSSQLARATSPTFDRTCVACHTSEVSDADFVFTVPGAVPRPEL